MLNTSFDLILEKTNDAGETEKETVKVVLQELSPFIVSDVFMSNLADNGLYKTGSIVKQFCQEGSRVIVSPKNLVEKIESADNAIGAINAVFSQVKMFCNNPRKYIILQKQSEAAAKSVVDGNTESNADGSETA